MSVTCEQCGRQIGRRGMFQHRETHSREAEAKRIAYKPVLPTCECGHAYKDHPRPFSATGQTYNRICIADGCHCAAYRMGRS